MSYEFKHRGDMWFGNVYDVYESDEWIGGVMQGGQDPRWSSVTPSGRGAEPLPFATREEAAAWLGAQGERIPKSRKWRYSPPAYAILGPVGRQGMGENGSDFQWSEPRGMHWSEIALYIVLPLWVLSAALPMVAQLQRRN
jgi:hypothetical protein